MAIKTIQSDVLRVVWENDDLSILPTTYNRTVRDILFDLDAAQVCTDLEDIGAVKYHPTFEHCWSITVTVNNVEPCGAITCDFWQGDCYNVDLREYNA